MKISHAKVLIISLTLTFSSLLTGYVSAAQDNKSKLHFSVTEMAPGLFMLMAVGGFTGDNIALSIGDTQKTVLTLADANLKIIPGHGKWANRFSNQLPNQKNSIDPQNQT